MRRPQRDSAREERIHNEAIVDARPEEQAMSWYYYLESKIRFPFGARCVAESAVSPLRKGETCAWPLKMPASMTCLYRSVGRGGRWPFLSRNWRPSIRTDQPRRGSATGVNGVHRAVFF